MGERTLCECGHNRAAHAERLPAPCGHGWDESKIVAAVEGAAVASGCPLRALGEETERQRAAGACQCIGFSPRRTCACVSEDARRCVEIRYQRRRPLPSDDEGCQCACHDHQECEGDECQDTECADPSCPWQAASKTEVTRG